jgi:hypothetical protein
MCLLYLKIGELNPSSEATSRSATPEFLNMLWNTKVHYRVHTRPLVPILRQIKPVHITPSTILSLIHFIIIHPPKSS